MIRLDNVSKYYYSTAGVSQALRKIKLEFNIGEFVAITGESGSGKTTLLNLISGFDTFDEGEIYIDDTALSYFDDADREEFRKNKIGFVFQNYELIDNYSALANVESALFIQGLDQNTARSRAKELLEKVDLIKFANQKASKLSSGQKQRLAIARALAKNTDIIIADEPTGNLDSESGNQVLELLQKLSKDKLVLMVTHNYEQAEQFVTRKVRIHDGELVSDEIVRTNEVIESDENKLTVNNVHKSSQSIAARFAWLNFKTQKGRAALFLIFLIFISLTSFLFIGQIISNSDDTLTKIFDDSNFKNDSMERIVVAKNDGKEFTDEELDDLDSVKYVDSVDSHDLCNDINYYINEGEDFEYSYGLTDMSVEDLLDPEALYSEDDNTFSQISTPEFLNEDKFMRSTSCLTEDDLKAGSLPTSRNSIVLYSDDESIVGTVIPCYFSDTEMWGDNYYNADMYVSGILKEKTDQVYFDEELCDMLSTSRGISMSILLYDYDWRLQKYLSSTRIIPVIDDRLTENLISLSQIGLGLTLGQVSGELDTVLYDVDGQPSQEKTQEDVSASEKFNSYSDSMVGLSEEEFYKLYPFTSTQASVYVDDYIHIDEALEDIRDMGYTALSSYKTSALEYDDELESRRLLTLVVSFSVLVVLGVVEILILKSFLKLKKKDFKVLRAMGISKKVSSMINYFEMWGYVLITVIVAAIGFMIAGNFDISFIDNMLKYYSIKNILIYVIYNYLLISLTVASFNHYLHKKMKWS